VEAHHGTMEVQSTLGKGTQVTLRLPLNLENQVG
jgi:signal transduction histidine kinase